MSKKRKKGKALNEAEALAYVARRLRKAAKYTSPAMITKATRRPTVPLNPARSAADDVAAYRARLDGELWAEYLADDDPTARSTAQTITKAAGTKRAYDRRRARAAQLVTNPADPAQQKWAFDYEHRFTEAV
jgi:hypothetical protein